MSSKPIPSAPTVEEDARFSNSKITEARDISANTTNLSAGHDVIQDSSQNSHNPQITVIAPVTHNQVINQYITVRDSVSTQPAMSNISRLPVLDNHQQVIDAFPCSSSHDIDPTNSQCWTQHPLDLSSDRKRKCTPSTTTNYLTHPSTETPRTSQSGDRSHPEQLQEMNDSPTATQSFKPQQSAFEGFPAHEPSISEPNASGTHPLQLHGSSFDGPPAKKKRFPAVSIPSADDPPISKPVTEVAGGTSSHQASTRCPPASVDAPDPSTPRESSEESEEGDDAPGDRRHRKRKARRRSPSADFLDHRRRKRRREESAQGSTSSDGELSLGAVRRRAVRRRAVRRPKRRIAETDVGASKWTLEDWRTTGDASDSKESSDDDDSDDDNGDDNGKPQIRAKPSIPQLKGKGKGKNSQKQKNGKGKKSQTKKDQLIVNPKSKCNMGISSVNDDAGECSSNPTGTKSQPKPQTQHKNLSNPLQKQISADHRRVLADLSQCLQTEYEATCSKIPMIWGNKDLDMTSDYIHVCMKHVNGPAEDIQPLPYSAQINIPVDSDSESFGSEEETDSDPEDVAPPVKDIDFMEFVNVLERNYDNGVKRVMVSAGGGRGKTVASKCMAFKWAKGECFKQFGFDQESSGQIIIRIDLKNANYCKDLFDALTEQYPCIQQKFKGSNLELLKEALEVNQEAIVWILDGLDEAKSKKLARLVFSSSPSYYRDSLVILLLRPEAKEDLDTTGMNMMEFSLEDLTLQQCLAFVSRYPFDKPVDERREKLILKIKQNIMFQKLMFVPFCVVVCSSLFNDDVLSLNIEDEIDIFVVLPAYAVKVQELKRIDIEHSQLNTDSDELEEKLSKDRKQLRSLSAKEIILKYKHWLTSLGYALFMCNGCCITGFEDVSVREMRKHLGKYLSEKDVESVLKLGLFEIHSLDRHGIVQEELRYYHRNPREMSIALFLKFNIAIIPTSHVPVLGKFTDSMLSVLRCMISLHAEFQEETVPDDFKLSLTSFLDHVSGSCQLDRWRTANILADFLHMFVQLPQYRSVLQDIIISWKNTFGQEQQMINKKSRLAFHGIGPHYFCAVKTHASILTCADCSPKNGKRFLPTNVYESQGIKSIWPDCSGASIYPLLCQTKNCVAMTVPVDQSLLIHLDSSNSVTVIAKRPQKKKSGSIPSIMPGNPLLEIYPGVNNVPFKPIYESDNKCNRI
jgi:hypothetical protein